MTLQNQEPAQAVIHSLSSVVVPATLLYLCQRPFYKIFVKFRNSKNNVLKIVLIIVNINKDENESLILNQFSLKIRVITKLPNSEQSSKGKVKTHKYINRQNQSTTGKLGKP